MQKRTIMHRNTRREFLQATGILLAAGVTGLGFEKKTEPLLSFSTLGCPDWSFDKILNFAVEHGYRGLEIRGIQREMDLPKCNEFKGKENIKATTKKMQEHGLRFVGLGSSANLHLVPGAARQKNLDEARRFIDLANEIDCPYIRVFPNNFPAGQEKAATMDLMSNGLLELAKHANETKVTVLMETHGDLVRMADLKQVMEAAEHPHSGLVWDISNMWTVTKEPPAEVYELLKKYIRHTHIKDANIVDGKIAYTLLGRGAVPVFEAIDVLERNKYKGFYSFEWEKLWHPEILEPEVALADYPRAMKKHFSK
jgi:sugar phosphate isomerase/epimerase